MSPTHTPTGVEYYDVAIVGGGIVGLATAREILGRYQSKRVVVLEREAEVANGQTGYVTPLGCRMMFVGLFSACHLGYASHIRVRMGAGAPDGV